MNGIMESAEWVYNASENSWQLAEQFKTKYNKLQQKQIDEMQLTDFQNFLAQIR
jgi:ABC-type nitrate/sulfonate/bicarbonate transport system substrate-binding protein